MSKSELGKAPALRYLGLGCGVQSGTLAEMIAEGDLPSVDMAIFADTGDEPEYVYEYRDYLKGRLAKVGIPLVTVTSGNLVQDLYGGKRSASIPLYTNLNGARGVMRRQCTNEYKIAPIEKHVRSVLVERGLARRSKSNAVLVNKGVQVECWLGLSLDEVQRMKPNPVWFIENCWPLIDKRLSRMDCLSWLRERELPQPKKSSCRICPYHNDDYWRFLRDDRPNDWKHAVKVDADLRGDTFNITAAAKADLFLYRSGQPLDEVDLRTPEERGQTSFMDMCDEGYCGI